MLRSCFRCGNPGHSLLECPYRVICYYCGQDGHTRDSCPFDHELICFHCGQLGHIRKNCSFFLRNYRVNQRGQVYHVRHAHLLDYQDGPSNDRRIPVVNLDPPEQIEQPQRNPQANENVRGEDTQPIEISGGSQTHENIQGQQNRDRPEGGEDNENAEHQENVDEQDGNSSSYENGYY